MMSIELAVYFVSSFLLSLVVTLVAERLAPRVGAVARPAADRWHRREIPLLGGIGIVIGVLVPVVATAGGERRMLLLTVTALCLAGVGLVDDLRALSPQVKLLAQILLSAILLQFGFVLHLTNYHFVNLFLTLLWFVAISNAFNLLDNMDGLSASIAIVAAGFRLVFFQGEGDATGVRVCAMFLGAVAGFLVRNFPPAKIFMGDTGSLFIGFFLAALSIAGTERAYSRGIFAILVIPVLLLLIPIFDTVFVTTTRLLSGRSIAAGGRDHTSHRLVAIGLSERQTVLLLATISAGAGGVALLSYGSGMSETVVVGALLVLGLLLLGVYLSRVRVVRSVDERNGGAVLRLLADFQYKRQVLTLALDICLILVAYYAAYLIRFEQAFPQYLFELYGSLPIVLIIQLVSLAAFGLYRGIWQYTGVADVLRIVKATTVGTMTAMILLLYTNRFHGFSRSVFILDWLLLIVLLSGSRASFRFFTEIFRARPISFDRVLIYGAGDGGELIVRELLNNPALQRIPVGFIDDDRTKHQTRIHGLPVFGGTEQIELLVRDRAVSEVIVSSAKIRGDGLATVESACERLAVPVRRASFRIE